MLLVAKRMDTASPGAQRHCCGHRESGDPTKQQGRLSAYDSTFLLENSQDFLAKVHLFPCFEVVFRDA